ncbi:DsrE family protein [bacterium]|nr:DsrE family protein [bacterium]MBU1989820.1 DsrE family protein [bacterium]
MKKIILMMTLLITFASAQDTMQKAVFDCSSGDMGFVHSRIWLIQESAKEFTKDKTPYDFVLTIHSGCTEIADMTSDNGMVIKIQNRLKNLAYEHKVKIEVCEIALKNLGYEKEEILPYIDVVPNSITRVIKLQNKGYALIPYN